MSFWGGVKNAVGGFGRKAKDLLIGGSAVKNLPTNLPQYDATTNRLGQIADTAQGRIAPTIGAMQLAGGPQDQARQGMMDVTGRLGGIAAGTQAGAGELAVNRQLGSAFAAQNSAARSARGPMSALAYRNAMRNSADIGLSGAGMAAQAQMQDQQAANQQLGALYGTMRGQDIQFAGENAQLGQQANMANQQAQLNQTQMNDAYQIQAIGQQLGWDQARINLELQRAGIKMQDKGILPGLIQAGGSALISKGVGGAAVASDERLKKNIRDGSFAAGMALGALRPVTFDYRDPRHGQGQQFGVTAQDLERSPLADAVVNTPQGKMVDPGKLSTGIAAILPTIDDRIKRLEADTTEKRALASGTPPMPWANDAVYRAQIEADLRRKALQNNILGGYSGLSGTGSNIHDMGGQ